MSATRKVYAHGELFWWLGLLTLAAVLLCVLAREARGTRHPAGFPLLITTAAQRDSCLVTRAGDPGLPVPLRFTTGQITKVSS